MGAQRVQGANTHDGEIRAVPCSRLEVYGTPVGMQDAKEQEGSMTSTLGLGEGLTSGHLDNPALPPSPAQHPGQGTGRTLLCPTAFLHTCPQSPGHDSAQARQVSHALKLPTSLHQPQYAPGMES